MSEESRIVTLCNNQSCKFPIYLGDHVWRIGKKMYCHIDCLMEDLPKYQNYTFTDRAIEELQREVSK